MFENGVLRRISEPKRDEVTEESTTMHNAKLHMYSSPTSLGISNQGE
jgi:hypothetical protein